MHCGRKLHLIPPSLPQPSMKHSHEFNARQFGKANFVFPIEKKLNRSRLRFQNVNLNCGGGIAEDHRSPRTASKSSKELPEEG
jgi:hypothetical protein